jgi:hypothetical protein
MAAINAIRPTDSCPDLGLRLHRIQRVPRATIMQQLGFDASILAIC